MIAEDTVLCDDFERMGGVRLRFSALWRRYRTSISAFLAIGLLYLFLAAVGIGCPLKFFSGISCPGCGMTRAAVSLLRLDVAAAFYYHPLVFLLPPVALALFFLHHKEKRRAYSVLLYLLIAAFVAVYLWRMLCGDGTVVRFAPLESLPARLWRFFRN